MGVRSLWSKRTRPIAARGDLPGVQQSRIPARPVNRARRPALYWRALVWLVLVLGACLMILPFLWMVTSSVKEQLRVFQYPPQWIPDPVRFENYVDAFTLRPWALYVRNTMVIVVLNEIAILGSASFCAYGFARIEFPGRDLWFSVLLATMMLPGIVTMVPQFVIFTRLGWVDTFLPLTVPAFFGGGAFSIFLLRQFFRTLPAELADSARIDGCSEFMIYWRIMLPLAKPALATVAVFTFIGAWTDFMGPLLYLSKSPEKYTAAIGLAMFRQDFTYQWRWDLMMAASTALVVPILVIFFAAQRYFIQGIAVSGIKG
jgi:ABC-type glycerol-3-phosphate transport system permease component